MCLSNFSLRVHGYSGLLVSILVLMDVPLEFVNAEIIAGLNRGVSILVLMDVPLE